MADENAPDPSFRFIPPSCPTCGVPHVLVRKFNGGDPIAFYEPDCDCDDDPEDDTAVFPVYMAGTIVGPVERIVAADHAIDDEVGTYEVESHIDPDPPGFTPDPETTRRMAAPDCPTCHDPLTLAGHHQGVPLWTCLTCGVDTDHER